MSLLMTTPRGASAALLTGTVSTWALPTRRVTVEVLDRPTTDKLTCAARSDGLYTVMLVVAPPVVRAVRVAGWDPIGCGAPPEFGYPSEIACVADTTTVRAPRVGKM